MTEIRIGQRTIPLLLTTYETIAIQEQIGCTVAQLRDEVFGVVMDPETGKVTGLRVLAEPARMKKMGALIRILGNAGLEERGEAPDLTDKWVLRNIRPATGEQLTVVNAVLEEINAAMLMEAGKQEETGPVDEVLEEENRKKEPRN